ncbi:hypothetical protein HaLaN_29932 [Haematococcus lacustris]|uniref:Uncharacterized protein n=1 Tax=Haematococcus lacustris TaxID=44745 RepID=A0A6A0AFD3_HAELA|nr:hypothetical protein HaLaN_29932 [Haematococcus lacustris]
MRLSYALPFNAKLGNITLAAMNAPAMLLTGKFCLLAGPLSVIEDDSALYVAVAAIYTENPSARCYFLLAKAVYANSCWMMTGSARRSSRRISCVTKVAR